MNYDYVPGSDPEFDIWQDNLVVIVDAGATAWGIPADAITALKALQTTWKNAFAKANNIDNRTRADIKAKEDARDLYERKLRAFVAEFLSFSSKVADSEREKMGLTVRSNSRTPVQVPVTRPTARINFSQRMQHTIHFSDETTPLTRAKPKGVHGCEIWVKIDGDAPKDVSELTYLTTHTDSPYVIHYDGTKTGKMAHYWFRWVNNRGQAGPWSIVFSAMING